MKKLTSFAILLSIIFVSLIGITSFSEQTHAQNIGTLRYIVTPGFSFKKDLRLGDTDPDVAELQRVLNADVDTMINTDQVGARGREGTYFGALTKDAVIRFQNKYKDVVLTLNSITTADGVVNKATRTRLNLLIGVVNTYDSVGFPQNRVVAPTTTTYVAPVVIAAPPTQPAMSVCQFVEILISIGAIDSNRANLARSTFGCSVINNNTPFVDVKVNGKNGPLSLTLPQTVTVSWTSSGVTSCVSGGSISKPISGSQSINITNSGSFRMVCTGPGVSVSDSVVINSSSAANLNMNVVVQPTNTNATFNITSNRAATYKVYVGTSVANVQQFPISGTYTSKSYVMSNLQPSTRYYYKGVAVDSNGVTDETEIDNFVTLANPAAVVATPTNINPLALVSLTVDGTSEKYNAVYNSTFPIPLNFNWMSVGYSLCQMISEPTVSGLNGSVSTNGSLSKVTENNGIYSLLCKNSPVSRTVLSSTTSLTGSMKLIPAGTFTMGSNAAFSEGSQSNYCRTSGSCGPAHSVTLNAYYMDKYEVTMNLWNQVKSWGEQHGYDFSYSVACTAGSCDGRVTQFVSPIGSGNQPARRIPWTTALIWANAHSEMEGLRPAYYTDDSHTTVLRQGSNLKYLKTTNVDWDANGYRLPTEAEWEYAAKATTTTKFPWGNNIDLTKANTCDVFNSSSSNYSEGACLSKQFKPVGSYPANSFGVYDMIGNAAEWVWDCQSDYTTASVTNPNGGDPAQNSGIAGFCWRGIRGGAATLSAVRGTSVNRERLWPQWGISPDQGIGQDTGFRTVRKASASSTVPVSTQASSTYMFTDAGMSLVRVFVTATSTATTTDTSAADAAAAEEEATSVKTDFGGGVVSVLPCADESGNIKERFSMVVISPCGINSVIGRAYEYNSITKTQTQVSGAEYGVRAPGPVKFLYDSADGKPIPIVGQTILGTGSPKEDAFGEKCTMIKTSVALVPSKDVSITNVTTSPTSGSGFISVSMTSTETTSSIGDGGWLGKDYGTSNLTCEQTLASGGATAANQDGSGFFEGLGGAVGNFYDVATGVGWIPGVDLGSVGSHVGEFIDNLF